MIKRIYKKKINIIRVKSSRLLIRETKLLLLSRLIKKFALNKTFIINILLYYNYSLNKKIKR